MDSEKKIQRLVKKVEALEAMVENQTREIYFKRLELQKALDFSEGVLNSLQGIILVMEKNGKLVKVNHLGEKWLNSKKDDLLGKNIRDLLGSQEVDFIRSEFNKGETLIPIQIPKLNNMSVQVSRSQIFLEDEKIIYYISDRTRQKELEKEANEKTALLFQTTQLASLGEMAASIAHEINNPISIIDGQLRRLKGYIEDGPESKQQVDELTEKIASTLKRIIKIVNGLRRISRSGDGDPVTKLNIFEILNEAVEFNREKIRNQDIKIKAFKVDEKINCMGKEGQVLQVINNLIGNSIDAILEIENRWIMPVVKEEENFVLIKIIDSGEGIPSDILEKIFNPFFTTKELGKGTGIGLAISKKMLNNMNGDIFYELNEKHTSFVIKLPKAA